MKEPHALANESSLHDAGLNATMRRAAKIAISVLIAGYILSYLGMTLAGAYIPFDAGIGGIKSWIWTPRGFADDTGQFRHSMFYAYLPLIWLDSRLWHNDRTGMSGPHRTLKQPSWRLFLKGSKREFAVQQLEQVHALLITNSAELLRAEYKTADLQAPIQVELRFQEEQITSISYFLH
jgi:hypothetical protein